MTARLTVCAVLLDHIQRPNTRGEQAGAL